MLLLWVHPSAKLTAQKSSLRRRVAPFDSCSICLNHQRVFEGSLSLLGRWGPQNMASGSFCVALGIGVSIGSTFAFMPSPMCSPCSPSSIAHQPLQRRRGLFGGMENPNPAWMGELRIGNLPGVSMTLKKWVHDQPLLWVMSNHF